MHMNIRTAKTIQERREALEKETGSSLHHSGHYSLDDMVASTRNCENMIGVTQIPLGIAGPLLMHNAECIMQNYYIPLATTEGALVASVSRGCKVITQSGGVVVEVEDVGATRGPVFRVETIAEGQKLETFLFDHFDEIKNVAASTSHHLTLKTYMVSGVGKYRFVRFVFDTGEAMGLNMVTIATTAIAEYIYKTIGIQCVDISGNFCVDKKPSWLNFIHKRGKAVRAEVTIPSSLVTTVLKTTPQAIYDAWLSKCMYGSLMSGSLGFNAQYANVVAALFLATGQDPAHIVEGSMGVTTTEVCEKPVTRYTQHKNSDLYVSVYLPDLMVGTIGGGTGLATQREALTLLGLKPGEEKSARTLAGIIGGAVLAGEISLLASLAEGSLAHAHEKLARGK